MKPGDIVFLKEEYEDNYIDEVRNIPMQVVGYDGERSVFVDAGPQYKRVSFPIRCLSLDESFKDKIRDQLEQLKEEVGIG